VKNDYLLQSVQFVGSGTS